MLTEPMSNVWYDRQSYENAGPLRIGEAPVCGPAVRDVRRGAHRAMRGFSRGTAAALAVLAVGTTARAASSPPVALLTRVAVTRSAAADRVMFTFRSRPASVHARYVSRTALVAMSGRRVPVAGKAFLRVVMRPASGVDLSGNAPVLTYRGAKRIRPTGGGRVREVVEVVDFEAVLVWAVGLDARRPYTIARAGPSVIVTIK